MTFREFLAKVVEETPGARAAVIMGSDGIPLDEYRRDGEQLDLSMVAIECQRTLEESRKVVGALEGEAAGALEELVFQTSRYQFLFRPVDEEYFLVVAVDRDGFLGKARFLIAGHLQELREEL